MSKLTEVIAILATKAYEKGKTATERERIATVTQEDRANAEIEIKALMLEMVEEVYSERTKAEARQNTYEKGTRLVKRLLKQHIQAL